MPDRYLLLQSSVPMCRSQCFTMVLALALALQVASSAVYPIVPLSKMAPDHACYFICEICFGDSPVMEHELMDCANRVCPKMEGGNCAMPEVLWLGNKCRNYNLVAQLLEPSGPAGQTADTQLAL